MAKALNKSTSELAAMVISMDKEERFARMKQFYIKFYPKTEQFFRNFKRQNNYNDAEGTSDKLCDVKASKKEDSLEDEPKQTEYYENISTFENLLELIDFEDQLNPNVSEESKANNKNELDILFEDFINYQGLFKESENLIKTNHSKENLLNIKEQEPNTKEINRYDQLMDEIFNL